MILLTLLALPQSGSSSSYLIGGLSLAFLVISLGVHEAAHAFVAWRCGDSTAKDLGRMTLDPIPHIDPFMTLLLPAMLWFSSGGTMMFGGAKPVPVQYHRLRNPSRDMMFVALAGPISNFLLAILFFLVFKLLVYKAGFGNDEVATLVMWKSMQWNCLLAAFNLIPIPPLDGSRVMSYLLPDSLRGVYNQFENIGMFVILALMLSGLLRYFYLPAMHLLTEWANFATGGGWA